VNFFTRSIKVLTHPISNVCVDFVYIWYILVSKLVRKDENCAPYAKIKQFFYSSKKVRLANL